MTLKNRTLDSQSPTDQESLTLDAAIAQPTPNEANRPSIEACCFHCQLPIPGDLNLYVKIDNIEQSMCCYGCKAVAEAIVAAGHSHFYHVRTEASPTGNELVPDFLQQSRIYDNESVQREFVRQISPDEREASLILQGITCAACVWLNEQHIASLEGVLEVQVNYASRRAWVRWNDSVIKLSEILQAIHAIGYLAQPYNPEQQQVLHEKERRKQIRRLAVAGLFGMQVMMLSVSLYIGAWSGMEQNFESLFRWLSLGLTLPVFIFSASGFFRTAWYDLLNRRVGMDVPVSLAIVIAFGSSLVATVQGEGEIYFDSVVMFVFLLLVSRYFEWMARQRSAESVERLAHALPLMANRLSPDDDTEQMVAAALLAQGDIVLVKPGETVPADGEVLVGESDMDESLLNGESRAVNKKPGDRLVGGSINITNPLRLRVEAVGSDTVLSGIHRMIERAQSDKPPMARLADRIASRFIVVVLGITASVATYWWIAGSDDWFAISLSVLIVTCPCALSLATPAAIGAGLNRLQSLGLLVKRARAIDALAQVTHVVFDKTGTLTQGKPGLQNLLCDGTVEREYCLKLAASLELYSEHPLAKALMQAANVENYFPASEVSHQSGGGISAKINGQHYAVGSIDFVEKFSGNKMKNRWLAQANKDAATAVGLASNENIIALFLLHDEVRADATALVSELKSIGKRILLMTGDRDAAAQRVAQEVGIDSCYANLDPQQKMEQVKAIQVTGARVLMVGDGINDAPVLSSADVSIAMGSASSLAKNSADIVMLANRLRAIIYALSMSKKIQMVIKQNFSWAIAYNICAIPAAALGWVAPWMAAIGMSLSSLIVVANALRLTHAKTQRD